GWRRPILWDVCLVYFTPGVAERVPPSGHVLHMTDSLWDSRWYRPEYEGFLHRIARTAHVAAASTPALAERLAGYGFEAHHLPHGVDIERFEPVARGDLTPPPALAARPRPRLGFVGNVEDRLDADVLVALAATGSVTLVGPVA